MYNWASIHNSAVGYFKTLEEQKKHFDIFTLLQFFSPADKLADIICLFFLMPSFSFLL